MTPPGAPSSLRTPLHVPQSARAFALVATRRAYPETHNRPMPVAIFDMDGVLYRGSVLMPYARETLARLRKAGWQVFFATNNSTATREEYVTRLTAMGLGGAPEHVITSAYATAHYLERLNPKPKDVLVIGADGLRSEIRAVGIGVRAADALPGSNPPPAPPADGVDPGPMRRDLSRHSLAPRSATVCRGVDLRL